MKYHVLHIKTNFAEEWQKDLFDQQLCDLGVDTIDGEMYYIPSEFLGSQITNIQSQITNTEGASLLSVEPCPDANWNALWESERPMQELPMGIRITPHCAFGAGHHETTSMMIEELITQKSKIKNLKSVLDHGTGTGVLAIFAKRLGAEYVLAIDIDDKSVDNAKQNAALNDVEIDVRLGSSLSAFHPASFNLILANIHRNVLLANMQAYSECLAQEGQLWLSGFYEQDCPTLIEAAKTHGLQLIAQHAKDEWRMLQFSKIVL